MGAGSSGSPQQRDHKGRAHAEERIAVAGGRGASGHGCKEFPSWQVRRHVSLERREVGACGCPAVFYGTSHNGRS